MSAVETTFHFARAYSPFALAVVLAAVAIAGWWSLGREASFLSKRTYVALAGLRVLPFLILIVLLMKPVLVYYGQTSLKQQVAIVFDESESMAIADKVFNGVQLGSAAYVLGLGRERTMWPPTDLAAVPSSEQEKAEQGQIGLDENDLEKIKAAQRLALVRRAFGRDRGALLERLRRDFILSVYGFSDHLREMPFGSEISPTALLREIRSDGASTHLGTALQRLVQDLRGQPVAGIVAISDGRNLGGIPPLGAAEVASDARIPVYAVPVGAGGSRDIAITALIAESAVFKGDEFPISARIASRGYSGYSVPVVFECDGAEIESRPVALTGKEQLVTFRHKRAAPGQIKVLVRVRAQEGEETSENNSAESFVRVIDKKIKVLMAEEIP
ncbi:hypothetical protein FJY63_10925, partial [Candidatus Sumerlaeota bacterium]|nr:hypothetical protein [Candidatus Sumerlaeota bacterium]